MQRLRSLNYLVKCELPPEHGFTTPSWRRDRILECNEMSLSRQPAAWRGCHINKTKVRKPRPLQDIVLFEDHWAHIGHRSSSETRKPSESLMLGDARLCVWLKIEFGAIV